MSTRTKRDAHSEASSRYISKGRGHIDPQVAAKQIRAIDHEGLQAHRETLVMKASKEAFVSSCKIMISSLWEVQRDARLGLEVPQPETLDQTLVEVHLKQCDKIWRSMTKGSKKKERTPTSWQTCVLSDRVICCRILFRHPSRKR